MGILSKNIFKLSKLNSFSGLHNVVLLSSATNVDQNSFKFDDLQIQLTKNPAEKPKDVNKLPFGHVFSDHMLTIEWNAENGWQKPKVEQLKNLSIHPAAKVLHYSLEIFEGLKAYYGVDGKVRLFRPDMNMNRLYKSAVRQTFPTFDRNELQKCLEKFVSIEKEWVPKSMQGSLYLRPTMIGTEPTLGVGSSTQVLLFIIASPCGPYFPTGFKPISLLADPKYVRSFPGGVGDCKAGSNYGPTIYVAKQAAKHGCQQVLWLFGKDHMITEAGTMNIFIVMKNKNNEIELVTPPLDGLILEGVTRHSILELTRQWKDIKVSERPINMKEFTKLLNNNQILEAFGSGTACLVCPIERILYDGQSYKVPTMDSGAIYMNRISKQLNDIQYGKAQSKWIVVVD